MSPERGDAPGRPYHHGDLRAALIEASFALLAESGPATFSVAAVARRLSVSTAAPYRHFRDRDTLLAAVATAAALDLAARMAQDADQAGPDPGARFAATAGTYVRFVVARGVGFNVIFSATLAELRDEGLAEAGRALIDLLFTLSEQATGLGRAESIPLLDQHLAAAHGYATLYQDGFLARRDATVDDIAAAATRTSADLIRARRTG